jgi:hypothetical protein
MASNEAGSHVGTITAMLSRLSMAFPLAGMLDALGIARNTHFPCQASWPPDYSHRLAYHDFCHVPDDHHDNGWHKL